MTPRHDRLLEPAAASKVDDFALVNRVRAGDLAAFELIMRRHNQRLYRLARGILRNASEAEDSVQEAYVRSFEKLNDFVGPDGFASWLGQIVVNEALGRLRRQARVVSLEDYADESDTGRRKSPGAMMKSQEIDPERLAASGELRRLIEKAIDALPDDFRTVFIMRAVEGMSVIETAAYLDVRQETVKTRFHRAKKQIQESLGAQCDALMPSVFGFAGQRCDRIVDVVLTRLR
jgi:RNA polymerase sigma-70 factor (ECF subfamily)